MGNVERFRDDKGCCWLLRGHVMTLGTKGLPRCPEVPGKAANPGAPASQHLLGEPEPQGATETLLPLQSD